MNLIMLMFTVATIIYLPLTFVAVSDHLNDPVCDCTKLIFRP